MEAHAGLSEDGRPHGMPALVRDERLAWLIGRGSERAFAALYERYHQQLYRYCRSMLHDDADAQDALQAAFVAAFAALRDGRREAPLRPWLFRIAHNEAVTILRRRRPYSELLDALPAQATAIEEQAEHHERLRRLVADFRELPERQRAALLMRELSGLSHEEIAVALETSVGTAKQSIYEARRALAEFEEGRMAACDEICRTISNGDRRALRARRIRAHLRECAACSAFAAAIPARSADLRALAPALPAPATALLLNRALAASVSRGSGSGAVGAGAAGKATVALSGAKVATTVALATTATIGVATALRPHQSLPARAPAVSAATRSAGARGTGVSPAGKDPSPGAAMSSSATARPRSEVDATRAGRVVAAGEGRAATPSLGGAAPRRFKFTWTPAAAPGSTPAVAVRAPGGAASSHGRAAGRDEAAGGGPAPGASRGHAERQHGGAGPRFGRSGAAHASHPPATAHGLNPVVAVNAPATRGAAAEHAAIAGKSKQPLTFRLPAVDR